MPGYAAVHDQTVSSPALSCCGRIPLCAESFRDVRDAREGCNMHEILVNELGDEHRDREWVDAYGFHWISCDGDWLWWQETLTYETIHPGAWVKPNQEAVNKPRAGYMRYEESYGPGPFMEAMHHKLLWEKR